MKFTPPQAAKSAIFFILALGCLAGAVYVLFFL